MSGPIALVLACGLQESPAQAHRGQAPADSLVVVRQARLRILDPVGRLQEISRRERLVLEGERLAASDLTFGTGIIVRLDEGRVILTDRAQRTYSDASFQEVARARKELLDQIASVRARVRGTPDEAALDRVLRGFQSYDVTQSELAPTGRKAKLLEREREEQRLIVDAKFEIFRGYLTDPIPEGPAYFRILSALSCFGPGVSKAMEKVPGFPLAGTLRYSLFLDRIEEEIELVSLGREKAVPETFQPPEGFRRVRLEGVQPEASRKIELPEKLRR